MGLVGDDPWWVVVPVLTVIVGVFLYKFWKAGR